MTFLFFCALISWFDWQVIKDKNFTVLYKPGYEWEALQALAAADQCRTSVWQLTGSRPAHLPLVIEDIGTSTNGFADPVFYSVHLFTYPPAAGSSLESIENWYRTVATHEYTHIVHLTTTTGISRCLTAVMGRLFQPNMYSPGWIIEGITVYAESQTSPYEGRLNDGFFESFISCRASDGSFPSIIEATNEPRAFPSGKIYLYGGTFYEYLTQQYGTDAHARFFKTYGSYPWAPVSAFFPALGLDIAARRIYGRSFPALFDQWRQYEEKRNASWHNQGTKITRHGWHNTSLVENNGFLYFAYTMPLATDAFQEVTVTKIMELDPETGRERILCTLDKAITSPLKLHDDHLYFTTPEIRRAANVSERGFGMTSVLHRLDIKTGWLETLFREDIRGFCVLPGNAVLYSRDRPHAFGSELWRYDKNTGHRQMVFESDYLINELDADSLRIMATARQNNENWDLYLFDVETGLSPLVTSPWSEGNINLKDDACVYSANYDSRYAVHLCDLSDTALYALTEAGSAYAGDIIGDALYYIGLTSDGFDIYKTPLDCRPIPPFPPRSQITPPSQPGFPSYARGSYLDVCATMVPAIRIPFIFPADTTWHSWVYGGLLAGQDATNENYYTLVMGYDQLAQRPVIDLLLDSYFFAPVPVSINYRYSDEMNVRADYPFFYRLQPGFSHLIVSCNVRAFDSLQRSEFTPILQAGYHLPFVRISGAARFPLERTTLGSDLNRTGFIASCGADLVIGGGSLIATVTGFNDAQNPDTPSVKLHGLETSHSAPHGMIIKTRYAHRLFSVRWGLWNPNIYFEDAFCTFFYETAFLGPQDRHSSLGIEIKIETKTGFGFIPLAPSVGVAWDPDPDPDHDDALVPRVFMTLISVLNL
ncbi:MAG TPA: hypothetical protein VF399_02425 [bacterium]